MKILYVGHYNLGSTTRMRGEYLQELLKPEKFVVGDIDVAIRKTAKPFLSFGWRYKKGPLIRNINDQIRDVTSGSSPFDLVWVDKGVFIDPAFIEKFKEQGSFLVHYTPDTAFLGNKSELFYRAIPLYDYCISTKSFESTDYKQRGVNHLLFCTQGYDERIHKPYGEFSDKDGVVFIGLCEPAREEIIQALLDNGIKVKLAGEKWEKFVRRNKGSQWLQYLGPGLFHEEYSRLVSGSFIGLGLLSKKFPETHTTRTFEIPACGTALATERNVETLHFFSDEDVIFFSDKSELVEKMKKALADKENLKRLTKNGTKKVIEGGFDYRSIMKKLLGQMETNLW